MGPATSESNGKADDAEQTAANAIAIKNGKTEKEEAFLVTETMPLFPTDDPVVPYGDLGNFRAWVQKNVKYPAEAFEKGIGGRVVLSFVVEKDGSVSDIQKLQAPDASLWEEARRVIASSPKWKPGEQRGQIVRVKYTLPVDSLAYESVRHTGPGIRKVVFQPATTKQTARRHNPDSPNRPAGFPESTGSTNRPPGLLFPSQAPADRHPLLIFKPPAGRPQKLPRLSQATEPTISGNGVHPEFSGRPFLSACRAAE